MVYEKIEIHPFSVETKINSLKSLVSESEYKLIMDFMDALQRGELTGKPISDRRKVKLIDMLFVFYKNGYKTIKTLTIDDVRKFKDDLMYDRIRKVNGTAYSSDTKEDISNTLIRFIEFYSPKKAISFASKHLPFRKWFQIKKKKKTPEILNETEVKKLFDASKTIEGKFLIAVLFDSGSRIEEFLNLRYEDIEEPTQSHPYYRFDFKEEYSKTNGRKISMFWEHSTETIAKYLASCESQEPKERIFNQRYDNVRMFLSRLGKKVLNKKVNPHKLRKSSATFYAPKLNRQQLCIRYGWTFTSSMCDIYISRSGLDEDKIKDVMVNTDLSKLRKDSSEKETRIKILEKKIEESDGFHDKKMKLLEQKMTILQEIMTEMSQKQTKNTISR